MSFFDEAGSGSPVDVTKLMDSGVPSLLWRIVEAGGLVSVGTTSDGGALGVTVTLDGRWRREYFRESDEATDWLLRAAEAVETEAKRSDASSAPRRRSRRSG